MQLLSQECCLQAVPLRLSLSGCPLLHRKATVQLLSQGCSPSGCPFQAVPFCFARPSCNFSLRAVPLRLPFSNPLGHRTACLSVLSSSGCPIQAVLFRLSHSVCPLQFVPFSLSSSGCPIQSVLSRLSHSGCPIQSVLFRLSHSGCPFQAVPFRLPPSGCFLQAGSFRLSPSGCPFRLFS